MEIIFMVLFPLLGIALLTNELEKTLVDRTGFDAEDDFDL